MINDVEHVLTKYNLNICCPSLSLCLMFNVLDNYSQLSFLSLPERQLVREKRIFVLIRDLLILKNMRIRQQITMKYSECTYVKTVTNMYKKFFSQHYSDFRSGIKLLKKASILTKVPDSFNLSDI